MKYEDIINMQEYRTAESLKKHPRMKSSDRTKIFSPFAALRGYEESIEDESMKKLLIKRPVISESRKEAINSILNSSASGDSVRLSVFMELYDGTGTIEEFRGKLLKIEYDKKGLMISADDHAQFYEFRNIINLAKEKMDIG